MACEDLTVLADRGYYNGDEVLACEGTGVLPYVPKTQTSGNTKRGLFTGQDFVYDAEHDRYICPAGQHLTKGKLLGSSGHHRSLPQPDRLFDLCSQAPMHSGQAQAGEALGA